MNFQKNSEHEALLSLGAEVEVGGTGPQTSRCGHVYHVDTGGVFR